MWLAPLRGLTDAEFRTAFARHFQGIDLAIAPFVTTHRGHRIKATHVRDLLPAKNRDMVVIPQILSKHPDDFSRLANHFFDMGYGCVNLNLGCPFPQVANKGRGSGMLPFPERIDAFLEAVIPRLAGRMSIKTRLGRHRPDEIQHLIPVFNRFPLQEIIIHPRTGVQMYTGRPDEAAFAICLRALAPPVIYNGDITCPSDFNRLAARFAGVSGWMIGRGVLANPFLPGSLKNGREDREDNAARFHRFHDDLLERYGRRLHGPGHLLNRMKGFWNYFANGFQGGARARKRIHRSRTLGQYQEAVRVFFGSGYDWVG
ncbi:MAG: tRNA-dihydrouridine synthase family protein [Desulfobacterales bacterium]